MLFLNTIVGTSTCIGITTSSITSSTHNILLFTTTTPAMSTSSSSGPSVYHIQMGNSKEHPGIWALHWEGKDLEKLIHDWLSTFLL